MTNQSPEQIEPTYDFVHAWLVKRWNKNIFTCTEDVLNDFVKDNWPHNDLAIAQAARELFSASPENYMRAKTKLRAAMEVVYHGFKPEDKEQVQ